MKRSNKALDKIINHLGIQDVDKNIHEELRNIISAKGKIKAIKTYREHTGLGLKESKKYIDNLVVK